MSEVIKFWNANTLNKGLLIVSTIILICVVYTLSQETFMLWHFPEASSGEYKSAKVKKFPAGFQDPKSIYIDKFNLPSNIKKFPGVYISTDFPLPPPAKPQDDWSEYKPPNPFARLNFEAEEGYSTPGPFSVTPRYGITPNFCCMGANGKSCYSQNCADCKRCFEQDSPINQSIKMKDSQQMYT